MWIVGERKSRGMPLLPLWVFVVCSRVSFTFYHVEYVFERGTWDFYLKALYDSLVEKC
jgi:hypothetical protein